MKLERPQNDRVAAYLRKTRLFANLGEDKISKIISHMHAADFAPEMEIPSPDDSRIFMCVVADGCVEVRKKDGQIGAWFLADAWEAGAVFGEVSLVTGRPHEIRLNAVTVTRVLMLTYPDFQKILDADPELWLDLAKTIVIHVKEAMEVGTKPIRLLELDLSPDVIRLLPEKLVRFWKVILVAREADRLTLAMVQPENVVALDRVRALMPGLTITPVRCSPLDFEEFVQTVYPRVLDSTEQVKECGLGFEGPPTLAISLDQPVLQQAPVPTEMLEETLPGLDDSATIKEWTAVSLVDDILGQALATKASDVHIEPREIDVVVRIRIDGNLRRQRIVAKEFQLSVTSRLKTLTNHMKIDQHRLPQDGRFSLPTDHGNVDFRMSTVPAKFGERIVLRILDRRQLPGLPDLFVDPEALKLVYEIIREPHGIIYVTGPTGSGKTTTLYSILRAISRPEINILTVEDPIEYHLDDISQVATGQGLSFALVLQSFLRQDPEVILVGETRNRETATTAAEAALTGHLILTTLHANDAPATFTRIIQMGIEPFLVSDSTIAVIAQRLVRRICRKCKTPYVPSPEILFRLGLTDEDGISFASGQGCEACGFTGYRGQVAVYEVLRVNERLRRIVASRGDTQQIRESAIQGGMKTFRDYALVLLRQQVTSPEEVLSVIPTSIE